LGRCSLVFSLSKIYTSSLPCKASCCTFPLPHSSPGAWCKSSRRFDSFALISYPYALSSRSWASFFEKFRKLLLSLLFTPSSFFSQMRKFLRSEQQQLPFGHCDCSTAVSACFASKLAPPFSSDAESCWSVNKREA